MDKVFSSGNPVSIFENCGGDWRGGSVGNGVGRGYTEGLRRAVAGLWRACGGWWVLMGVGAWEPYRSPLNI